MCGRRKHIVDTGIIENDIGTNMWLNKTGHRKLKKKKNLKRLI